MGFVFGSERGRSVLHLQLGLGGLVLVIDGLHSYWYLECGLFYRMLRLEWLLQNNSSDRPFLVEDSVEVN